MQIIIISPYNRTCNLYLSFINYQHTGVGKRTCFVPTLTSGVTQPTQIQLEDKFGGLPWGFPIEKWPVCAECEIPLSFIAQFCHHDKRLPLGKPQRVLYLFQCEYEGECETWEPDGGANQVLILEQDQLTNQFTLPPDSETPILPEFRVNKWAEVEDQDDNGKDRFNQYTKLGGSPSWIQSPQKFNTPYHFVGQINSLISFTITDLEDEPRIEQVEENGYSSILVHPKIGDSFRISQGKEKYHCQFSNFGDAGTGYLFVNPDPEKPTGKFLWQC